eukprot:m.338866 g.338866  ORF g.338866 m.338866 type:complete len:186 (+) comp18571_c0_seq1:147-704(+)
MGIKNVKIVALILLLSTCVSHTAQQKRKKNQFSLDLLTLNADVLLLPSEENTVEGTFDIFSKERGGLPSNHPPVQDPNADCPGGGKDNDDVGKCSILEDQKDYLDAAKCYEGLRKNLEDKDSHEGTEALSKILNLIISEAKCRVKLQEKQKVLELINGAKPLLAFAEDEQGTITSLQEIRTQLLD